MTAQNKSSICHLGVYSDVKLIGKYAYAPYTIYVTSVLYTDSYICLVNNDRQNDNFMWSFVQEIDKTTVIIFMILLKKKKDKH